MAFFFPSNMQLNCLPKAFVAFKLQNILQRNKNLMKPWNTRIESETIAKMDDQRKLIAQSNCQTRL